MSAEEAVFTIKIYPDRTQTHVTAGASVAPAVLLAKAIAALQAEFDDLAKCPFHQGAAQ